MCRWICEDSEPEWSQLNSDSLLLDVAYAEAIDFISRNFVTGKHAIAVPQGEDILLLPIAVVAAGL